jgi:hypothetical protein
VEPGHPKTARGWASELLEYDTADSAAALGDAEDATMMKQLSVDVSA